MSEPPPKQPVRDFLHQFVVGTFAVLIAENVVPGITSKTNMDLLLASLVLGALNAFLRPFLLLGCLPLLILTLGLFLMVINAVLLMLTSKLMNKIEPNSFTVDGFWSAFWGALVISIVTLIANTFTRRGDSQMSIQRTKGQNTQSTRHDDDDGPVIDV